MRRRLEPEVMDGAAEAESYADAAAMAYLGAIDTTFVDRFFRLGAGARKILDVGTGPGQIPIKIAHRSRDMEIIGIDLSDAMLEIARKNMAAEPSPLRVRFEKADAAELPFEDASFDAVLSNSLLHHLEDPIPALNEIARVVKPDGAILLCDLRRPPGRLYPLWARFFGRRYRGTMRKSYEDSLKAAFTPGELREILKKSRLQGCRVFRRGLTHIGIHRLRNRKLR